MTTAVPTDPPPSPFSRRVILLPAVLLTVLVTDVEKTRKALGNRFSLKGFHTAVLNAGSVPLDILERQIDDYIRRMG